jgi:undecaprenyl-diphosphatase
MDGFDRRIDAAFERWRGRPGPDRAAALLSNLADYGFIWVVLALFKGRHRGPDRRRAVVALGAAGVSSLVVSRAVKASAQRERPELHLDARVRTPSSSSFPSGHTLAAFCTAVVLSETDLETAACLGFASAVATSRVHLKAHHPSDVVGGALIGSVLGLGLRPVVNVLTPGTRGRSKKGRRPAGRRKGMGRQDYLLKQL